MKRYKLLKDLPTFKAGDEFYIDSNNNLRLKVSDSMAYNHYTLEKFPNILTDWFEEIPESKRWRAEYNEKYWCNDGNGGIYSSTEDGHKADSYRFLTGNYFKTEEEAEVYKEYLLARQVILDDADGGRWSKDGCNWYAFYNGMNLDMTDSTFYRPGTIYFQETKAILKSLEEHREQWEIVRKYEMGEV